MAMNPERKLAAHVQAAVAAAQAKMGAAVGQPTAERVPAPRFEAARSRAGHVQRMVAAAGQPTLGAGAKTGSLQPAVAAGSWARQARIPLAAGSTAMGRSGLGPVVQRAAYKCKKCKVVGGHEDWCADNPQPVVAQGPQVGVEFKESDAKGKGAVEVSYGGSTFTGAGKGCAEPKLLDKYACEKSGKKKTGVSLEWTQNTLPCDSCHALLKDSSLKYSNTFVVRVEGNLGKPYGSAHGLPNNADTVITYKNGTASYAAS